MCWLSHLSTDDVDALLATAKQTAGPLGHNEARAVLIDAAWWVQRGASVTSLTERYGSAATVQRIIGRPGGVGALGAANARRVVGS